MWLVCAAPEIGEPHLHPRASVPDVRLQNPNQIDVPGPNQLLRPAGAAPHDRLDRTGLPCGENLQVLLLPSHRRVTPYRHPEYAQHRHRIAFAEWTEALNEAG